MTTESQTRPATASEAPSASAPGPAPFPDMVWIPGGTFLMGSDKHYPEERPVTRSRSTDSGWTACR